MTIEKQVLNVEVQQLSIFDPLMSMVTEKLSPIQKAISYYHQILLRLWYILEKLPDTTGPRIQKILFSVGVDDIYMDEDEDFLEEEQEELQHLGSIISERRSYVRHVAPHVKKLEQNWRVLEPDTSAPPPSQDYVGPLETFGFYHNLVIRRRRTDEIFLRTHHDLISKKAFQEAVLTDQVRSLGGGDLEQGMKNVQEIASEYNQDESDEEFDEQEE
ncbi:hypothetical protein RCL1_006892 [Eukaryota sp. TZLM3-RCL]